MTNVIGGFQVVLGTDEDDELTGGPAREVFYGLAGDDTLTNETFEGESYFVGGTGDDSYVVSPDSFTIIHETGNDDDDEFVDSITIGAGEPTVATVDGRHLLFNYEQTGTAILFVDWQIPRNQIETFFLYDGVGLVGISYEEFSTQVPTLGGFVGDVSLEGLGLIEDLEDGIELLIEAVGTGSLPGGSTLEEAETVALLYEAGLDRDGSIDFGGLNFWIDEGEGGLSFRNMAEAFLVSEEFEAKFGVAADLTPDAYVALLYDNVLDREGDLGGVMFWTGVVSAPGADRAQVLLDFAVSVENTEGSNFLDGLTEIAPGVWDIV
ncbi:MAG: DUF4214 domain-containing protein [Pseudomonadota bacterium]